MGLKFKEFFELVTEARRYEGEYVVDTLEQYKDDPDVFISFTHNLGGPKLGINPQSGYSTPLGIYAYPVKAMWKEIEENNIPFAGEREYIWVFRPKVPNKVVYASKFTMEDVYKSFKDKIIDFKYNDFLSMSNAEAKAIFMKTLKRLTPELKMIVAKIFKYEQKILEKQGQEYSTFEKYGWSDFIYHRLAKIEINGPLERKLNISDSDVRKIGFMFRYENSDLKYLDEDGDIKHGIFNGKDVLDALSKNHQKNPAQIFMSIARYMTGDNPTRWAKEMASTGYIGVVDDIGSQIIHKNEPKQAVFFRLRDLKILNLIKHKAGSNWARPHSSESNNKRLYESCRRFLKHKNFDIRPDGRVDINTSLEVRGHSFEKFPFPIGKITGDLTIINTKFSSFDENSPEGVYGNVVCIHNPIESLKGFPKKVDGYVSLSHNALKSLIGLPESITYLDVSNNELTTLEGCPKKIYNGYFNCGFNQLTSLEYSPEYVGGDFICQDNRLTTLEGCTQNISGKFDCADNELKNFIGGPKTIRASKTAGDIVYFGGGNPLVFDMTKSLPVEGLPSSTTFYFFSAKQEPYLITQIHKAHFNYKDNPSANEGFMALARGKNAVIKDPEFGECLAVILFNDAYRLFDMRNRKPVFSINLSAALDSLNIIGELE